jgi:hypothetical protein
VAAIQAAGDEREAFAVALQGLRGEIAKVHNHDPRRANSIWHQLTDQVLDIAAKVPTWKPSVTTGRQA